MLFAHPSGGSACVAVAGRRVAYEVLYASGGVWRARRHQRWSAGAAYREAEDVTARWRREGRRAVTGPVPLTRYADVFDPPVTPAAQRLRVALLASFRDGARLVGQHRPSGCRVGLRFVVLPHRVLADRYVATSAERFVGPLAAGGFPVGDGEFALLAVPEPAEPLVRALCPVVLAVPAVPAAQLVEFATVLAALAADEEPDGLGQRPPSAASARRILSAALRVCELAPVARSRAR
jgi:hypothetical protein